ncbi:MAG: hypothetical protein A2W91_20075 [Bacteroidetes bacterium GWF2_38_335]|nr:MAG: hypothetical protein A2W91_20075 [Bacteroidetes bacterium GWF2_38_335]OFY81983.1 MAG: hypothetical protein A2281_09845 [Bacteroidetes bacterium RIFOXYA12_FULL_38_20]HBS86518.1 hypothetical protein [Bacteroidales bacterium]
MKQFRFIVPLAILAVVFLVSCGGKGEKEEDENPLNGNWKVVKAEGNMADMSVGVEYIFEDGKKMTMKGMGIETKGTITKSDDKTFTVTFEGVQQPFVYNYKFEGEQLVIELQNSGGQKFFLEKQ